MAPERDVEGLALELAAPMAAKDRTVIAAHKRMLFGDAASAMRLDSRRLRLAQRAKRRSRRLFVTTNTLENAIAAPAITGLSRPTAASGMAATL